MGISNMCVLRRAALAGAVIAFGLCAQAKAQTGCAKDEELTIFGVGGPNAPSSAQSAPVDLPTQGIYAGCLNEKTGHLTPLGIQAKVSRASWILANPTKSVIYSTGNTTGDVHTGGTVFSFHVDPVTGALQSLGTSPSGGSDPTHLAWDPHSQTLFVANHGEGIVGVIKAGPDGGIHSLNDKVQQEGSGPAARQKNAEAHGLVVDPTGHFVLCADFGADKLYIYRYDSVAGKLTPSSPAFIKTPPGSGPRHLAFSPDGRFVVMNTELNGQVRVYHWDGSAGTVEEAQVVDPFPVDYKEADKSAAETEFSKDGKFFYLSLRGKENTILTYKWNASEGRLTEIDRVASAGGSPWSFRLDPSGKWMLIASSSAGGVSVFAVDRLTGKITPTNNPLEIRGAMTIAFAGR